MILNKLRERREQLGWTKAECARRAELNAATVGWVESGRFRPYPTQALKLARTLRLNATETRSLMKIAR